MCSVIHSMDDTLKLGFAEKERTDLEKVGQRTACCDGPIHLAKIQGLSAWQVKFLGIVWPGITWTCSLKIKKLCCLRIHPEIRRKHEALGRLLEYRTSGCTFGLPEHSPVKKGSGRNPQVMVQTDLLCPCKHSFPWGLSCVHAAWELTLLEARCFHPTMELLWGRGLKQLFNHCPFERPLLISGLLGTVWN